MNGERPKRTEGRTDEKLHLDFLFYRDYIKSPEWEARKAKYYARHAKACRICGSTENVQLNHIKYAYYGYEADRDLVPLCREHHQLLHERLGVQTNMRYSTRYFLEGEIKRWDAEHEVLINTVTKKIDHRNSLAKILDKAARPIWKVIDRVTGR